MIILPHQIPSFFDAYYKDREEKIRAIDSDAGLGAVGSEMSRALQFTGFRNALSDEIVWACFEWLRTKSPYAAGLGEDKAS